MEQYMILIGISIEGLEKMVNDYLKQGWILSGGVAVELSLGSSVAYYQAVYKPKA